jgi:hypothetical protein
MNLQNNGELLRRAELRGNNNSNKIYRELLRRAKRRGNNNSNKIYR